MDTDLLPFLFDGFDYMWNRVRNRTDGLTDAEYFWEPVGDVWTVRNHDGRWIADWARPDPVPAPVTTIAWRMWHIADCLASYVAPHHGEWPLPGEFRDWVGEAEPARTLMDTAYAVFRERMTALGEDGIRQEMGPAWGPYEHEPWSALVLHAIDEIVHHGAEIALLRDLYIRLG
jgi:DinB superfamily